MWWWQQIARRLASYASSEPVGVKMKETPMKDVTYTRLATYHPCLKLAGVISDLDVAISFVSDLCVKLGEASEVIHFLIMSCKPYFSHGKKMIFNVLVWTQRGCLELEWKIGATLGATAGKLQNITWLPSKEGACQLDRLSAFCFPVNLELKLSSASRMSHVKTLNWTYRTNFC